MAWWLCSKQKKRSKGGDGGRNKENIIEDGGSEVGEKEDQKEDQIEKKKELCYEVKHSDIMGRLVVT